MSDQPLAGCALTRGVISSHFLLLHDREAVVFNIQRALTCLNFFHLLRRSLWRLTRIGFFAEPTRPSEGFHGWNGRGRAVAIGPHV